MRLRSALTRWQGRTSGAILISHIHSANYHILSAFRSQLSAFDTYSQRIPTLTAHDWARKADIRAHSPNLTPEKYTSGFPA
jgi:hypothetical protein